MNKNTNTKIPFGYFITFSTYGTWLPGDNRFSVSRKNNIFNTPKIQPNLQLNNASLKNKKHRSFKLNSRQREIVLRTTQSVCTHYEWVLLATHVRSNHAHIIVRSYEAPEFVMKQIKAYCTRRLREEDESLVCQKIWTRHGGSTRYIWESCKLYPVLKYVIEEQGKKMACYCHKHYESMLREDDNCF